MALKNWKRTQVGEYKTLWTKGDERFGDFVHVLKTSLIGEWEVATRRTEESVRANFKFFKGKGAKSRAFKFARSYMRSH